MQKVMGVTAKNPLANRHCSPYDEAIAKNATILDVNFPISPDVSILHDGFGTKPKKDRGKKARKDVFKCAVKSHRTNWFSFYFFEISFSCCILKMFASFSLSHWIKRLINKWMKEERAHTHTHSIPNSLTKEKSVCLQNSAYYAVWYMCGAQQRRQQCSYNTIARVIQAI